MRKKICISILTILIIFLVNTTYSYATDSIMEGADAFLEAGQDEEILSMSSIKIASDSIFKVLYAVGTCIVVIVGAVLGIQFIMGSVEEKAKIQEALIPFVIGSLVIFGAITIWSALVNLFQDQLGNIL